MIKFGSTKINTQAIIKLDLDKKLMQLNKKTIITTEYRECIILKHKPSNALGIGKNKKDALYNLVLNEKFKKWYNMQIAKIMGYEHLSYEVWLKNTKNIVFEAQKNNKWLELNQNFFSNDYLYI